MITYVEIKSRKYTQYEVRRLSETDSLLLSFCHSYLTAQPKLPSTLKMIRFRI